MALKFHEFRNQKVSQIVVGGRKAIGFLGAPRYPCDSSIFSLEVIVWLSRRLYHFFNFQRLCNYVGVEVPLRVYSTSLTNK